MASGVTEAAEKSEWLPALMAISPTNAYLYHMEAAMVIQPSQAIAGVTITIVASDRSLTIKDTSPHQTRSMVFLAALFHGR